MQISFDFYKNSILFIGDMHIPYHHKDSFKYLKAMKAKYRPKLVVSVGDLADFHDMSFHDSDADLMSAGDELKALRRYSKELEKMFPNMHIVGSNHGDLPARKAFAAKMPQSLLRPYNEIYGVGKGWKFTNDLTITHKSETIYVAHGICKDGIKLAARRGVCFVSGHYHSVSKIDYVSNPFNLLWSMQTGCLIDKDSLAFAYNKLDLERPIISSGVVVGGQPRLEPMVLTSNNKWTGRLA